MAKEEIFEHIVQWAPFQRRHEANIFNALFYDTEAVSEEEIADIVERVAKFFDLPLPLICNKCDTFAKILTGSDATECELYYNIQMLTDSGINNRDAFTMCFVHEMSHQLLYNCRFNLFENERWIHELAADLMAGVYANRNLIATGKYKYVLSRQTASETHPGGGIRAEIVDYGRLYFEKCKNGHFVVASDVLALLPAFVYLHYDTLKEDWERIQYEISNPTPPSPKTKDVRIEDLPDSNLLKQMVMRIRSKNDNENEDNG